MKTAKLLFVAALAASPAPLFAQASGSTGADSNKQNPDMQPQGTKGARESAGAKTPAEQNAAQTKQDQTQFEEQTLTKLHAVNQHEIQMGNLARDRALSEQVKNYGETLVQDHQQLDRAVTSLAERNDITLPNAQATAAGESAGGTAPNQAEQSSAKPVSQLEKMQKMQKMQQAQMRRLESSSGAQFDREFLSGMVQGHQQAIQMVRTARNQAQNTELKSLLSDALPTLQQHLDMAQRLQREANKGGTTSSTRTTTTTTTTDTSTPRSGTDTSTPRSGAPSNNQ
jgi:putative membrane protein